MNKIKLKGCNCKQCKLERRIFRNLDKRITKKLNRAIRNANKQLTRNPDSVFDPILSYYYA